jgi:hypothetical protein
VQHAPISGYSGTYGPQAGTNGTDRSSLPGGHLSCEIRLGDTANHDRHRTLIDVLNLVVRPLPLTVWLAVPVLFAAAVLGVTAIFGVLLDADWQVTLSPVLFGAAAAVTALIDVGPEWSRRQQVGVRVAYPTAVFTAGLVVGGIAVPTPVAVLVGLPALVIIGCLCRQEQPSELSRR